MPAYAKGHRNRMLRFSQLTYNSSVQSDEQGVSIAEQLRDARRASRAVSQATASVHLALDFSELSRIRVDTKTITIYVKSAAQQNRLKQILPRISRALADEGFLQQPEIRIRPVDEKVDFSRPVAQGGPREMSQAALEAIDKKADSMAESALKDALKALAASLRKTPQNDKREEGAN